MKYITSVTSVQHMHSKLRKPKHDLEPFKKGIITISY